jgi:hypothetical protein
MDNRNRRNLPVAPTTLYCALRPENRIANVFARRGNTAWNVLLREMFDSRTADAGSAEETDV